ncbi:MAG: hypothetical protein COA52_01050 [Hyphomicrobiales bacterium]|nr:MAG: hypothetical protein COA52_01050 [Hyphomicrobiales bacterium]
MEKFKQHLKDYKKKFVSIRFTKETNEKLMEYCKDNNVAVPSDFVFHLTVMYSSNEMKYENSKEKMSTILEPKSIGKLGDAAVIHIKNSKEVIQKFDLLKSKGFKHSYPSLKQHVSISYENVDISNMKIPDFNLTTEYFIVEDQ